ncbi:MAG: 3-methyl-2-oxobutanoate hydroxymethyltransferase [Blastochloris sp.]|nr:3-methyl-2-oxobutanoate hydroxymethyltransferase [Blastochloris sp.]
MSEKRAFALNCQSIRHWKELRPILAVTAYDYPMARHLDEAGVDILHVGDSLGMVMLGHDNTTQVTMEDILRATEAVAKARKQALITADLPYRSYENPEQALINARRLVAAGADAVKMEGGRELEPQILALRSAGIEMQGHLGMLPQHVVEEGGYRKKGRRADEVEALSQDALFLETMGMFSIVLEAVVAEVAGAITRNLSIPTIGIASGLSTTGQIQVCSDLLGMTPWWSFPHVKPQAQLGREIQEAFVRYRQSMSNNIKP